MPQGANGIGGQGRQVHLLRMPVPADSGQVDLPDPRLNAKHFEGLIVKNIRENILTESNIRDLVKIVDEEMDGRPGTSARG